MDLQTFRVRVAGNPDLVRPIRAHLDDLAVGQLLLVHHSCCQAAVEGYLVVRALGLDAAATRERILDQIEALISEATPDPEEVVVELTFVPQPGSEAPPCRPIPAWHLN